MSNTVSPKYPPHAQTPPPLLTPMKHLPKDQPRTPEEELVSALKSDILRLQRVADVRSNRDALNIEMRKTEAELLRISHLSTSEAQLPALLTLLRSRVQSLSALASSPTPSSPQGVASPASGKANNSVFSLGGSQASLQRREPPSIVAGLIDLPPAFTSSLLDRKGSLNLGAVDERSDGGIAAAAPLTEQQAAEAGMQGGQDLAGDSTTMTPSSPKLGSYSQVKPISADSMAQLTELGIVLDHNKDGGQLDLDNLVRKILAVARGVKKAKLELGQKVRGVVDVGVQRQQQLLLEVDGLKSRLMEKEREINEMKHQLSSSRYAFNAPRALTTVHDAPMSFEVERQYQRELHRSAARVKELEKAYENLFQEGVEDRENVKKLTAETARLRAEIDRMNQSINKVESEKAENRALFLGVSQTREKEVRMSNNAVKQLENRVESLDERLKQKTAEADSLKKNLESMTQMWLSSDTELKNISLNFRIMTKEAEEYKQIYDEGLAENLEKTQQELLRVWTLADEREGQLTIQKQMLEDVEALKGLAHNENQMFMERLKASTEWKMLTVKAAEETKQLAVRLMMLSGDKEKREAAMSASHAERLNTFRGRAEREVRSRADRHRAEVHPVRAKDLAANYELRARDVVDALQTEDEERKRTEKLTYAAIKEDYVQEATKRVVEFRVFYDEKLDTLLEAEMHSL